jgi:hypothetical protein
MKKQTTFGLKAEKLASLLKIGEEEEQSSQTIDQEQTRVNQLRDALAESIPLECPESVHPLLKCLCRELLPLSGQSQGQLLVGQKTELETLEKIKNYHKYIIASSEDQVEKETSGVIYYAAIASALIHYNSRISQHPFEQLAAYFATLLEKKWIISEITELFNQAIAICQKQHKEESGNG